MADLMNRTERVWSSRSLACFLQGLEGQWTTIELRNEITVTGTVVFVDSKMNIALQDVQSTRLNGDTTSFDELFILGRQIRYVQVPDSVNVMGMIHNKVRELLTQRKVQMNKQQMMKRRRVKNDEDRKRAREFKLGRGRGGQLAQLDPLRSSVGQT